MYPTAAIPAKLQNCYTSIGNGKLVSFEAVLLQYSERNECWNRSRWRR